MATPAVRVAGMADHVCDIWRGPDAGIWEVRDTPRHFTHSKVMCWVALDRAIRLAEEDDVPRASPAALEARGRGDRGVRRDGVLVGRHDSPMSSTPAATTLDASLLMLSLMGYGGAASPRVVATVDAIARELRRGPFVYRYLNADGLPGSEGSFVNCSFWLVGALARSRKGGRGARVDDRSARPARTTSACTPRRSIRRPATFLGNFPQALVHLSLIDAALAIGEAEQASQGPKKGKASS